MQRQSEKAMQQVCIYQSLNLIVNIISLYTNDILTKFKSKACKIVKNVILDYYCEVLEKLDNKNIFQAIKQLFSIRKYMVPLT